MPSLKTFLLLLLPSPALPTCTLPRFAPHGHASIRCPSAFRIVPLYSINGTCHRPHPSSSVSSRHRPVPSLSLSSTTEPALPPFLFATSPCLLIHSFDPFGPACVCHSPLFSPTLCSAGHHRTRSLLIIRRWPAYYIQGWVDGIFSKQGGDPSRDDKVSSGLRCLNKNLCVRGWLCVCVCILCVAVDTPSPSSGTRCAVRSHDFAPWAPS